jgi:hypothetical protein
MSINITFRSLASWPVDPTPSYRRRRSPFRASWAKTIDLLEDELRRINAKNVVIEADCPPSEIRIDGHLRAGAKLRGPGVVISIDSPKGSLRFPCDAFLDWQDNVRAIALSLEALRTIDRYGVTRRAEQYKGWTALPDSRQEQKTAQQLAAEWIVQQMHARAGLNPPTVAQILSDATLRNEVRKTLSFYLHPDRNGGQDEAFKQFQNHMAAFEDK